MEHDISISKVTEFIKKEFGMENINIQINQPIALVLEEGFTLLFDFYSDSIRISILKPVEAYQIDASIMILLGLSHFTHNHNFTLQPGYLSENLLTLSAYIAADNLTLPIIHQHFEVLLNTLRRAITGEVAYD